MAVAPFPRRSWGLGALALAASVLVWTGPALAYDPPVPIDVSGRSLDSLTFTRLIVRDEDGKLLGMASGEFRVIVLEHLRKAGLNVKGAESLLFDQDDGSAARFQLGGVLSAVDCRQSFASSACEVVIEWQLFDTARRQVVYRTTTRGYTESSPSQNNSRLAVERSLDSLLSRERFVEAMALQAAPSLAPLVWASTISVKRCGNPPFKLPADLPRVQAATVVLRAGGGVGSGVILSEDGYILTAAHVVKGLSTVEVTGKSGVKMSADVLRVDEFQDVALIHAPGHGLSCLSAAGDIPAVGEDLYAVGSPAGTGLEFSVAKGVVSGIRSFDELRFVQTDASLNQGNSGGPLVDAKGRLVAVVSWKVAAPGFEGLGFGVPVDLLESRLGMAFGDKSTEAPVPELPERTEDSVEDPPDASQLDVDRKALRAARPVKPPREPMTPRQKLFAAGVPTASAGAVLVGVTWIVHLQDPDVTKGQWTSMRLANSVGWAALLTGAGLTTLAIVKKPHPKVEEGPPEDGEEPAPETVAPVDGFRVWVGPSGLGVAGRF